MTRPSLLRWTTLAVTALLAGATLVGVSPASGQSTIDDKREEARQVAARLDELTARYSRLSDRSNEAQAELEVVNERITQAEDRLADTEAERDFRRGELQTYAVDAYLGGPDNSTFSVAIESRDQSEMPVRLGYLDSITGNRAQLLDDLAAVEEDVADRVLDLEATRGEAEALVAEIDDAAADAQQAIDEQEQLQSQIDAQLADLIEEQRAAEAAARQAEIDAAIAQQVADQAAQTPSDDPGDTGGDTGGGTVTPPPVPPPPASGAQGAVDAAMSQIGVRYQWGGSSPETGFDCSGLMMWAWARAGRSLPHSSRSQFDVTRRVAASDLQPGDLVFYGSPIHHVAMYIGGGQIVDALNSRTPVGVRAMGYPGSVSGYGRP